MIKYLKFLTKASNQHGVHSPFVYNLVTKCFYKKTDDCLWKSFLSNKTSSTNNLSNKKAKLLIRLIGYFKPVSVLEIGKNISLVTSAIKIGNQESSITTANDFSEIDKQFDFIYFNENKTNKELLSYFNSYLTTIKNDSFWVFDNLYATKETQETWSEIKDHKKVTVTVDLFFWGIVFFRKEQAKEHFKIRV